MRCDCALFYDPLYAVKYKLNQYQCGTKPTNAMESFTFRDDPCGSMYPGGVTEASAALISELTATGKLSETSLLEYARHKFVPSSSKNTTASSQPRLYFHSKKIQRQQNIVSIFQHHNPTPRAHLVSPSACPAGILPLVHPPRSFLAYDLPSSQQRHACVLS